MRAITLKQPWASLLMNGIKHHETRTWKLPDHLIGVPILLHAGKAYDRIDKDSMIINAVKAGGVDPERAIHGALLGSVVFEACFQVDQSGSTPTRVSVHQFCFGDYRPLNWYWTVSERVVFKAPVTGVKGKLGIWTYEGEYPL